MEVRRLVITGRVQGVGFRYAMVAQAQAVGAAGWVRNLSDGSVEALVAGSAEQVAAMIGWARRGPAAGRVDHVAVALGDLPESRGAANFVQAPSASAAV